ncbi:MAG: isocitrate/isopropylmalate family dehydrogenase [Gemmatimonadaceae bacterium]
MGLRIALIPGDGIGAEVTAAAVRVADAALAPDGLRAEWTSFDWGTDHYLAHGRTIPEGGLDALRSFDAILLGAVGDPRVSDTITLSELVFTIRRTFDQYLNLRPARLWLGVPSPLKSSDTKNIDLLIVRENTEGEYANVGGRFHAGTPDETALQTNVFTRKGCERVIRAAFELARGRRKQLTSITKSNAQAFSMTLWDDVFRGVALKYSDVATESLLVDAAATELVRRPWRFDTIVASNLFGDILSDLSAAIVGGLGVTPSGNINPERTAPSMFEPVHGSAPDIAGKGIANPIASILSMAMLLDHVGQSAGARRIELAVGTTLAESRVQTPDLGGISTTEEMTSAVVAALAR